MLTAFIIGLLSIFFISFIIASPIAFVKIMRTKKQKCPNCENEIRFAVNHGKCPKCRAKIFKHADGTLHLRN